MQELPPRLLHLFIAPIAQTSKGTRNHIISVFEEADSVGVAVAALGSDIIAGAYAQALPYPRAQGATLVGIDRRVTVDAEWAAYANATAMRQLDWSDTFGNADYSHPSDNTAAMVAVAQQCGLSGADLIRGIALGYETEITLVNRVDLHDHGIDQMAHLEPAIAAGLVGLLKPPIEQAYSAVSLAAFLSAAVPKHVKGSCLLNMVVGGMTPVQDTHQAADLGYRVAILPGILLATTTVAGAQTLAELRKTGKPLLLPEGTGPESIFVAMGAAYWDKLRKTTQTFDGS